MMMPPPTGRQLSLILLPLIGLLLIPRPAQATTAWARLGIEDLTDRSDLAIHGTVESLSSSLENQRIFTTIRVRVVESLKGRVVTGTVTLRLYGGVHGGKRTWIVGSPCFAEDEEVVLFLKSNGASTYDVVNLAEGKFQVIRSGSAPEVRRDLGGIRYVRDTRPPIPTTLDELKAAIRAAAGR